nr:unnamed protein product [Callosobruchus analis]
MVASVLERVTARHSKLCENSLDNNFGIDKYKRSKILDKIADIKLRKLDKGEFEKGIERLAQFNVEQVKQQSLGKIYYANVNGHDIPAVYDLLCEILLHSDSESASKSFHEATELYFSKVLSRYSVTEDEFLMQVKLFLPYAKLERLYQCKPADTQRAALEMEECILYPELSREQCYIALRNLYKSTQASLIRFDLIPAQDLPGNFGEYFKVKIVASCEGTIKTHHLFAKQVKVLGDYSIAIMKERVFFERIMKSYMDIGLDKLTDFCPQCYFTSNNILLFDDLSISEYGSVDFNIPVTLNWLATSVKVLAKFHATSIIFEEKLGKKLGRTVRIDTEYPGAVQESIFKETGEEKGLRPDMIRSVHGFILSEADAFETSLDDDTLKQRVEAVCSTIPRYVKKSDKIRNVLNHGDLWGANIMYKEDSHTGTASAYFIDFQMLRYAPPSLDIMFLIFVNADRYTRLEHLNDLIELYYNELTQILSCYSIDMDTVFSLDDLLKSCEEVEAIIICISLIYSRFLLMSKEQRQKLVSRTRSSNNKEDDTPGSETTPVQGPVVNRIRGLLQDLVIANHSTLCDSALDDSFIEKDKYERLVDKIPNMKLRKLSEDEFKNGLVKLLEFDVDKVNQETYGKVLYVEKNAVKVPAVYDLLFEVLQSIDAKVRARSFHVIIEEYYWKILSKYDITMDHLRAQIRLFLPYAKLKKLYNLCNGDDVDGSSETIWEVEECILYPELLREEVYSIVNNMYKSSIAHLVSFDVTLAKDLPGNLGKYFRINVTVETATETHTYHLFAKMIDDSKEKIIADFTIFPFRKERFFFEIVLERLKELGVEELTDFCPRCYFARKDMLIFEDISVDGYNSWNYQVPVSYSWLATTIILLAKLHASSIIFEEKVGDKLGRTVRLDEEYPDDVREAAFVANEAYKEYQDCNRRSIYGYLLSKFPEIPKRIQTDKLTEKVKVAYDRMYEIVNKSEKIRNVLNHGDMWGANIMYKEDKTTGVASAYLIDFQLIRYCPPSLDLMFLLYTNTDRATRVKHLKELLRLYYKELEDILGSHDIDLGNIFTFDQLMKSCKEVEPTIICVSMMYGSFLLMPAQQRKDIENDKERDKIFSKVDKAPELEKAWDYEPFNVRMGGLIEDIVRICDEDATMSVLDKVIANHSTLYDVALDEPFIEKNKYECIMDKVPNMKLRRLSEVEFKNGLVKPLKFGIDKASQETYGKVLCVEKNAVKVPAVYDLLCEVLLSIDAKILEKSFYGIIEEYYKKVLSKYEVTIDNLKTQVRLFLPYAKLNKLYKLCNENDADGSTETIWEIEECILYPELLREEVYSIVNSIYKSNTAKLISFDVTLARGLPGNLGKYFRIKVIVENAIGTHTHHLFSKMIDDNKAKIISDFTIFPFRKERFFFEIFLEHLKDLGVEELADFCPKCYFARKDMLIFEDVSVDGYSSWNYHVPVSYNWLATTIKLLAKLHASSIIYEEKVGDKLGRTVRLDKEYPDHVREAAFTAQEEYKDFKVCDRRSIYGYLLSKFPEVPKRLHMDRLTREVKVAYDRIFEITNKSEKIRNVLNHGDMWGGNIMYKEGTTNEVASAYLIDFQLIRYCPPSVDLMFLLYANTDRATRVKHLEGLLKLYYQELGNVLSSYDIDLGNIFTFDRLMESCKEVEPSVICISMMYGSFLLMPEEQRKGIQNDKERGKKFAKVDKGPELEEAWDYEPFKVRMEGLVEDIIRIYDDDATAQSPPRYFLKELEFSVLNNKYKKMLSCNVSMILCFRFIEKRLRETERRKYMGEKNDQQQEAQVFRILHEIENRVSPTLNHSNHCAVLILATRTISYRTRSTSSSKLKYFSRYVKNR